MKTQLDTPNREAFERYREAISCIDRYRASGKREFVEKTESLLDAAHDADPDWTRPIYLKSIVKDLAGDPQAAINELEQLKNVSDSSFGLEVKFNLGVAHYHRYGEEHLNEAETLFEEVKAGTSTSMEPLSILASSCLAQVYGMRVLLKKPDEQKNHKAEAEKWYGGCLAEANEALARLKKWKASKSFKKQLGENWVAEEIEWAANNAKGFAGYFWTDHLDPADRIPILNNSISFFRQGLELRPNHWATLSNLASVKMRLGYALLAIGKTVEGEKFLAKALQHIDFLLAEIRPNYAFALYERGRILRLSGRFEEAIRSFEAVLRLPPDLRDVSPKTIEPELELAKKEETYFLHKAA
jgi:tetratricopeptide (TPR) repeat protein